MFRGQGVLPFDAGGVVFVAGYFAGGRFVVADPASNLSYLESPRDFGARLGRDYQAAAAAGLGAAGRCRGRWCCWLIMSRSRRGRRCWWRRAWGISRVITASMPAILFADDHPGGGIPVTRVALVPGSGDTTAPVWTSDKRGRRDGADRAGLRRVRARAARSRPPGPGPGPAVGHAAGGLVGPGRRTWLLSGRAWRRAPA